MPCKLNHYCVDGLRYQCPASTPVTQGTGAGALNECLTCTQRNGNSANPIYDDLVGDCVSCVEYNSETPYWDGNACVACASGTAWNTDENTCVATIPQATECTADEDCVYKIPHGDEILYLVESADYTAVESVSPKSAEEETAEFKSKYGIVYTSTLYPDYWAGAMKYCQDKGLRLPTMNELVSIMNVVYGTNNTCENSYCEGIKDNLTIANTELWKFLEAGTASTISASIDYFTLWASTENSSDTAYYMTFENNLSTASFCTRRDGDTHRALCVR